MYRSYNKVTTNVLSVGSFSMETLSFRFIMISSFTGFKRAGLGVTDIKKTFCSIFFGKNIPCTRFGTHKCHNPNLVTVAGWIFSLFLLHSYEPRGTFNSLIQCTMYIKTKRTQRPTLIFIWLDHNFLSPRCYICKHLLGVTKSLPR